MAKKKTSGFVKLLFGSAIVWGGYELFFKKPSVKQTTTADKPTDTSTAKPGQAATD